MSNEVAVLSQADVKTILEAPNFVQKFTAQVVDEKTAKREVSFAIQAIMENEELRKCSPESIGKAVYNVAITGLSLNPVLRFAVLTPRWNSKTRSKECVLIPMYQGLVNLVVQGGMVQSVSTYVVYEGDEFEVELGTEVNIKHKPKFKSETITHAYAVAILPNGVRQIEVMNWPDLEKHRAASDAWKAYESKVMKADNCIWLKWPGEMCRKTVLRRLLKYLPKNKPSEQFQQAIEVDEANYEASAGQIGYAESLIQTSTYDSEERTILEAKLVDCTRAECSAMIEDLLLNQVKKTKKLTN